MERLRLDRVLQDGRLINCCLVCTGCSRTLQHDGKILLQRFCWEDFVALCLSICCSQFPLMFCNHRWLENVPVCERAMSMLPGVQKYVSAVSSKRCTDPKTKSFATVAESIRDPLLVAKLAVFLSIAKLLQPFLKQYD